MTPVLIGVIPDNFSDWSKETNTICGRTICVARRAGVTLQLVRDETGWWTVTKLHKGQVLARKIVKKLPSGTDRAVMAARRQT